MDYVGVDKGALQMIMNALERDAATHAVRGEMMEALRETMVEVAQPTELQKWVEAVFDNTRPMGNRLQTLANGLGRYTVQPKVVGPAFKEVTSLFQRPVTLKITVEHDKRVTVDLMTMGVHNAHSGSENLCISLSADSAQNVVDRWTRLLGLDPNDFIHQDLSK